MEKRKIFQILKFYNEQQTFLTCKLLLKWTGQNYLPVIKNSKYIYLYIYWAFFICTIYVFSNPATWAGCDTRSISKLNLKGLNSEFSFS